MRFIIFIPLLITTLVPAINADWAELLAINLNSASNFSKEVIDAGAAYGKFTTQQASIVKSITVGVSFLVSATESVFGEDSEEMQQLRTMNSAFNNYFEALRKEDEYSYREIDMMLESDLFNQYYSTIYPTLKAIQFEFQNVRDPTLSMTARRMFRDKFLKQCEYQQNPQWLIDYALSKLDGCTAITPAMAKNYVEGKNLLSTFKLLWKLRKERDDKGSSHEKPLMEKIVEKQKQKSSPQFDWDNWRSALSTHSSSSKVDIWELVEKGNGENPFVFATEILPQLSH